MKYVNLYGLFLQGMPVMYFKMPLNSGLECIAIKWNITQSSTRKFLELWGFLMLGFLLKTLRGTLLKNPPKFQELPGATLCNIPPLKM